MIREVAGRPIEVVEVGTGMPVLFLHGNPVDHQHLKIQLDPVFAARPGYRRIYIDLPGFGVSPPDPDVQGSEGMLGVVLEVIDELVGDERLLIVGESWGAYLARGVIARRATQVAGVALICPVILADRTARDLPSHQVLLVRDQGVADDDTEIAAAFHSIAVVVGAEEYAYVRDVLGPAFGAADPGTQERLAARYGFPFDVDALGGPFAGPSLVLAGRQDSIVGYADGLRLIERFPRATVAVLDVAGHALLRERHETAVTLMNDWLDRVEST
jgi:pimeloyl-ACP methyl ester carboxylesterase